jgi:hypothetical protein
MFKLAGVGFLRRPLSIGQFRAAVTSIFVKALEPDCSISASRYVAGTSLHDWPSRQAKEGQMPSTLWASFTCRILSPGIPHSLGLFEIPAQ